MENIDAEVKELEQKPGQEAAEVKIEEKPVEETEEAEENKEQKMENAWNVLTEKNIMEESPDKD